MKFPAIRFPLGCGMPVRKDAIFLILLCPLLCAGGCFWPRYLKQGRAEPNVPEFRASADGNPVSNTALQINPPPAPKSEPPQPSSDDPLQKLAKRAAEKEKALDSYVVRIRRKETID